MATIDPPIPDLGTVGAQPATDIVDALEEIRDEINGGLDNDNLAAKGIRSDKWPDFSTERVKEFRVNPEIKLVGGPALDLPEFAFGEQLILSGSALTAPGSTDLILTQIQFTYTKSNQFSGGNDPDNELYLSIDSNENASSTFPPPGGFPDRMYARIRVPGSAGVVSRQTVFASDLDGGDVSTAGAWFAGNSRYLIPTIRARATGANGPFSGAFTIHEIVFRYLTYGSFV